MTRKQPSIRSLSLYAFGLLILGALASALVTVSLVNRYASLTAQQRTVEDTYDAMLELKLHTERLLTTPELARQRQLWTGAATAFGQRIDGLLGTIPDRAGRLDTSWRIIRREIDAIEGQLASPLFDDRNLMEKSLLRRLGEGINANENSDYYVAVRTLVNAIDFLQQRQNFLVDDLADLNRQFQADGHRQLERTRELLVAVPSVAFVVLVIFAAVLSFLTGRIERDLLRIQDNLGDALAELEVRQQKLEEQRNSLDHLAHHDTLTGLPNRLLFLERLRQAVKSARRRKEKLALLFIDLDRFKEINDSLGHSAGDQVLKIVSSRFRRSGDREEVFARLGGDEFTVLIEAPASREAIEHAARSIIARMAEPVRVARQELYLTCSIGISVFPDDGKGAELLLRNADAAMYRAKEEGKNNFQFYTAEMTRSAYERVKLESNLRKALDQGEFEVHYQPQLRLPEQRLVGFEALIRWRHRDFGLISPASFIPIAEETGLIVAIGEWVLEAAARQAAAWHRQGLDPGRVAVNLAGKQITQGHLLDTVGRVLETTGCRPEWLELEVTEGLIMRSPDETAVLLRELADRGIEIAIDDFGTGYSSLAYLKHLPITKLKIDQSFVRSIPNDDEDSEIVKAIATLARGLGLAVIAEGVETREQASFLLAAGCPLAQGYLFGRPMPAASAEALMRGAPAAEAAG